MNATEPFSLDPEPAPSPAPEALCGGSFNPFDCAAGEFDAEHRFLAVVTLSLAVTTCALYVLACVLTLLVRKIGAIWTRAALGEAVEQSDPNDARKGLLGEGARESSFSTASKANGKNRRASFAVGTSCTPTHHVDEEGL